MKKLLRTIFGSAALLAACAVPVLTACSDSDEGGNDDENENIVSLNPPVYEAFSAKYDITDSSSPYESIELGAAGDYLVTMRRAAANTHSAANARRTPLLAGRAAATRAVAYENLIYGTYTRQPDGSFRLEGFGTLTIASDETQQATALSITPDGGTTMTFAATEAATVADDELTSALCRTWKMVRMNERGYDSYDGEYNETYTPQDNPDAAAEMMLSKAGTFLITYGDGSIEAGIWKWENQQERQIRYSWDNVWYNGEDEGVVTLTFTAAGLTTYEYYKDYETGEWFEQTAELVEKNPASAGGDDDGEDIPVTTVAPADRVFHGQYVDQVDDHGLDKFTYQDGFLTQVQGLDGDRYRIDFEYLYLAPAQANAAPDVRYRATRPDGTVAYQYDVWLNVMGFAQRVEATHYDDDGTVQFTFAAECHYDNAGHLIHMYEGREGRDHELTWTDGDLTRVDIKSESGNTWYNTFEYGSERNADNLMFFYEMYDMDIEELKYLYWAGLLGISPEHLLTRSIDDDGDLDDYLWEADGLSRRNPDIAEPWQRIVGFTLAQ